MTTAIVVHCHTQYHEVVIVITCDPHSHPQALSHALSSYPMLNAVAAADASSIIYKVLEESGDHYPTMCIILSHPIISV